MTKTIFALVLSLPLAACSRDGNMAPAPKSDPNVIEMGVSAQKSVGLSVAPASFTQLTEYLHVLGTVQPMDSRIGYVRSLARGRVLEVLARVGDRVENGQPLARLDNIEAGELAAQHLTAHAELQRLKVQQANSVRQVERSQNLAEIGAISRKDLELAQAEHNAMLEAIKAQESVVAGLESKLRRFGLSETDAATSSITTIRSPFAGVVTRAQAAPGDVVDSGIGLFSITDLSEVWVQAEVYEKDLARVRLGQTALISVETYPDEHFSGTVAHISDTLDPKTRTAQVRCVLPNADRRLKLDMFVTVDVPTTLSRKVLAVPTTAIQEIGGATVVFVRQSEQTFQIRQVKVGQASGGQTEILTGLVEKEPVVVQGTFHLKSVRMNKELGEG
jgi:cobalt-zinc-cadmium efflux system membrane fusion protein